MTTQKAIKIVHAMLENFYIMAEYDKKYQQNYEALNLALSALKTIDDMERNTKA